MKRLRPTAASRISRLKRLYNSGLTRHQNYIRSYSTEPEIEAEVVNTVSDISDFDFTSLLEDRPFDKEFTKKSIHSRIARKRFYSDEEELNDVYEEFLDKRESLSKRYSRFKKNRYYAQQQVGTQQIKSISEMYKEVFQGLLHNNLIDSSGTFIDPKSKKPIMVQEEGNRKKKMLQIPTPNEISGYSTELHSRLSAIHKNLMQLVKKGILNKEVAKKMQDGNLTLGFAAFGLTTFGGIMLGNWLIHHHYTPDLPFTESAGHMAEAQMMRDLGEATGIDFVEVANNLDTSVHALADILMTSAAVGVGVLALVTVYKSLQNRDAAARKELAICWGQALKKLGDMVILLKYAEINSANAVLISDESGSIERTLNMASDLKVLEQYAGLHPAAVLKNIESGDLSISEKASILTQAALDAEKAAMDLDNSIKSEIEQCSQ